MNAGPTSVARAVLVVGQATCPQPSPQPSTPASVHTRTNRESTEVQFMPAKAVGAAPMAKGTRIRWTSIRSIFIAAPPGDRRRRMMLLSRSPINPSTSQAVDSGKEYAQNGINAAAKKLTEDKEQMGR